MSAYSGSVDFSPAAPSPLRSLAILGQLYARLATETASQLGRSLRRAGTPKGSRYGYLAVWSGPEAGQSLLRVDDVIAARSVQVRHRARTPDSDPWSEQFELDLRSGVGRRVRCLLEALSSDDFGLTWLQLAQLYNALHSAPGSGAPAVPGDSPTGQDDILRADRAAAPTRKEATPVETLPARASRDLTCSA